MEELATDFFTVQLPAGWSDVLEDATYSNPDELPPLAFCADGGVGTLYVSPVAVAPEHMPEPIPRELEPWVVDWAERRAVSPIERFDDSGPYGAISGAAFEMSGDYVSVWFLTDGAGLIHASYICPWAKREVEREARDRIVRSLRVRPPDWG